MMALRLLHRKRLTPAAVVGHCLATLACPHVHGHGHASSVQFTLPARISTCRHVAYNASVFMPSYPPNPSFPTPCRRLGTSWPFEGQQQGAQAPGRQRRQQGRRMVLAGRR